MPRQSTIRWRESDRQNLNKEVRRFNAKLDRLARANPGIIESLPERLSVRKIKGEVSTRAELNRTYRSIDRFFKPGAADTITSEQGITITKYEKREIGIKVGIINRNRTIERKGADVSTEKGTMGSIKSQNLQPKSFNFDRIRPGKEWDKFVESVEKQSKASYQKDKMEKYKENYLKTVKDNLGKKGDRLYDLIKGMDAKTLYEHYYDDPVLQIQFISDPIPSDVIAEEAETRWTDLLAEIAETKGGAA